MARPSEITSTEKLLRVIRNKKGSRRRLFRIPQEFRIKNRTVSSCPPQPSSHLRNHPQSASTSAMTIFVWCGSPKAGPEIGGYSTGDVSQYRRILQRHTGICCLPEIGAGIDMRLPKAVASVGHDVRGPGRCATYPHPQSRKKADRQRGLLDGQKGGPLQRKGDDL